MNALRHDSLRNACASMLAAGFVLTAAPAISWADQFVLVDVQFTYTKQDADTSTPNKSHVYVKNLNPQPTNWILPIKYRNGKVHIRTEVIDKPAGGEVTQWSLCYIANKGAKSGADSYGCTNTGLYTAEGVFERDVAMTSWWQNENIDWTKGIKEVHMVMKDSDGEKGYVHLRTDPEKFLPTTVRITMFQISEGATYDPSKLPKVPSTVTGGSGGSAGNGGTSAGGNTQVGGGNAGTSAGGSAHVGGGNGGTTHDTGGSTNIGTGGAAGEVNANAGSAGKLTSVGGAAGSKGTSTAGSPGKGNAEDGAIHDSDDAEDSGGCSIGTQRVPTPSLSLAMLAVAGLLSRRRLKRLIGR